MLCAYAVFHTDGMGEKKFIIQIFKTKSQYRNLCFLKKEGLRNLDMTILSILFNKIFGNACFWSKIEDCVVGGHQILSI